MLRAAIALSGAPIIETIHVAGFVARLQERSSIQLEP